VKAKRAQCYLEHTTQSVKKPTGFSGMNVANMVGCSKRTDSIKMLKMHLILCVQTSLRVQNRRRVYARMWAERGPTVSAVVRTTSQFTGRYGQTVCSPHFVASDFGPIQKLKYVFKGRKIREIVTISRM